MLSTMALVFSLQPFVGIADSNLDWNIAAGISPTSSPDVLSELEYKNISSFGAGFGGRLEYQFNHSRWSVFVEGELSYDIIVGGDVVDTDYAGDDRTDIFSKSVSDIEGDDLVDYEGGLGVAYQFVPDKFSLAAVVGGFHKEQNLNFQHGRQLIADPSFFFPSTIDDLNAVLVDLDSDYISEWSGNWWVALEAVYRFQWIAITSRFRVDDATYYGEGRWNLRTNLQQPKSFSHHANSSGRQWELGLDYKLSENFSLQLTWLQGKWETDAGVDNTFFVQPASTMQSTRLNRSTWDWSQVRAGCSIRF